MALFLTILKIIGLSILGILLFILAILLLLLFVPVRYKIKAAYDEENASFDARVSYLLHFVSVRFLYKGDFKMTVRILGIPIKLKKKAKTEDKEDSDNKEDNKEDSDGSGKDDDSAKSDKGKMGKEKAVDFLKLLAEDSTKAAWETCKSRLGKLLRLLLPRKTRINISYGLDNPYYTELVMTVYDVLYIYLDKIINICPVYDVKTFMLDAKLKGSIMLAPVLWHILMVILDNNCRAFYKKIKKK
ncbi:MAG: hypothetical protein KBS96_00115 [Lachnospiraceae bacterium]|nr:hypothetical protein [Candidatus Colinaster scatohippi]